MKFRKARRLSFVICQSGLEPQISRLSSERSTLELPAWVVEGSRSHGLKLVRDSGVEPLSTASKLG